MPLPSNIQPKLISQSRTIRFAALKPILLPLTFLVVQWLAQTLDLQADDKTVQTIAEAVVTAIPFAIAEIWLRFVTVAPVVISQPESE